MDGRRFWFWAGCLLLPSVLVACSTPTSPQHVKDSGYVLTVPLKAGDTQSEVLKQYGGEAVVWRPEAGFAILKLSSEEKAKLSGEISAQTETNSTLKAPEVSASGVSAWGGGWNAWGGGWNAWGGGWNAWGGGTSSVPTLPGENRNAWLQIRLPQAHALSKNFGAGHTVAVIDTGIDINHPMFSGRLAPSSDWKDFVDGDANPQEVSGGSAYGHGTAVAGIIAQIAPKAKILPIRVLKPDGMGDVASVASAIDWAIQKNARIINLSLGTNVDVTALKNMIDYATYLQYTVVTSAGNEGSTSTLTYPAAYAKTGTNASNLISVGSVQSNSALSTFSNRGAALEVAARGESIYTAYPGNQIAYVTGTSFAAPQVAGAIALGYGDTEAMYTANAETYLDDNAESYAGYSIISLARFLQAFPTFQRKNALFVVGSTTLNTGDTTIRDMLTLMGYTVTFKTGLAAVSADATGKDVVLISSTVNSADVNTKFKSVTTPVIAWESQLFDDMGMTSTTTGSFGSTSGQTQISLVNSTHPLSAGLCTCTAGAFVAADTMSWGIPAASAIKIATLASDTNKATIFAYNKGATLADTTAAAGRRVGLYFHDTSATNARDHWASYYWFMSAVTWAATGN